MVVHFKLSFWCLVSINSLTPKVIEALGLHLPSSRWSLEDRVNVQTCLLVIVSLVCQEVESFHLVAQVFFSAGGCSHQWVVFGEIEGCLDVGTLYLH